MTYVRPHSTLNWKIAADFYENLPILHYDLLFIASHNAPDEHIGK